MSTTPQAGPTGAPALPRSEQVLASAARGGSELALATLLSLAANYLFLLAAGRILGRVDYGTVAALTGLLTVVSLPSGALQIAVCREISGLEAVGERDRAQAFLRAVLTLGTKTTVGAVALGFALLVPLRELLHIDGTLPLVFTALALFSIVVYPVTLGVLQGRERFRALAIAGAAPMVVRLVAFAVLVVVGLELYGALGAMLLAALAAVAVGAAATASYIAGGSGPRPAVSLRPFLRSLVPVTVGLLGITVLTNVDILVVKARFSGDEAGLYAAASAFGRVAFFVPAAILGVLIPKTVARHARGEAAGDILGRSVILTAAFCALLTAGYALVGGQLVSLTYGAAFQDAEDLLVPFCVAMTLFSLANVALGYHISRGAYRFCWLIAAAAAVQVVVLSFVPSTPREVLWINSLVGAGLLVVHEVTVGSTAGALRAGFERFEVGTRSRVLLRWLLLYRRAFVEGVFALVGFTAAAVAATWPLARHLGTTQLGPFPNDGSGGSWWFWQLQQEGGYHLFGVTRHTLTGAPFGWEQGNALNFQWLLPDYPGYLVAGFASGLAALNVVALSGLALSGAAMFAFVRWLGAGRLVATWAGLVYLLFPWHMHRAIAGHVTLAHLEFFPLVLLAAIAWVRRPSGVKSLAVAAAVIASWLTSGYFGAMSLVAVATIATVAVVGLRRELGFVRAIRQTLPLWAIPVLATAVFAIVALGAGGTAGVRIGHSTGEIELYGAHPRDYLPDGLNPVVGAFAVDHLDAPADPAVGTEHSLYPGVLTCLLALFGLALFIRRRWAGVRHAVGALVVVTVVSVLFAAPSPARLAGIDLAPMPSELMFKVLPAFRVPSRFTALVMAALVPLAALGLATLVRRVGGRGGGVDLARTWLARAVVLVAIVVSVAELGVHPVPTTRVAAPPPEYGAVSRTPDGVLAEYPLRLAGDAENSRFLFWQQHHKRPLLNGPGEGTLANDMRASLVDPAGPGTAQALSLLGVASIVTRPATYRWRPSATTPDTPDYGQGYALAADLAGGVRVWRVTATPAPAIAAYRLDDVGEAEEKRSDGFVGYRGAAPTLQLTIVAKRSRVLLLQFEASSFTGEGEISIGDGRETRRYAIGERTRISVAVDVPRGRSRLEIRRQGTLQGTQDALVALSRPWLLPATVPGRPLHPKRLTSEPGF